MQQHLRKMKRVRPLINLRASKVTEETSVLSQIRKEKESAVKALRESQRKYIDGVEELNRLRSSAQRENLQTMEDALDAVKTHWYALFKKVQEVENREKAQVAQLLAAESDLKAIESLRDSYAKNLQAEVRKEEQKALDQASIRRHGQR